jgi:hypothetical protein
MRGYLDMPGAIRSGRGFAALLVIVLGGPLVVCAETVSVTGIVVSEQGARVGGANTVLCYTQRSESPIASDPTSDAGLFMLLRDNVVGVPARVYVIVLGDEQFADTPKEVMLRKASERLFLGKSLDIVRRYVAPTAFSYPLFSKEEAIARLQDAELAQSLLVLNGVRDKDKAQRAFETEAARILASVRSDQLSPGEILAEAKSRRDPLTAEWSAIDDDVRRNIPTNRNYLRLKEARFDPRKHVREGEPLADEAFRALAALSPDAIDPQWIFTDKFNSRIKSVVGELPSLKYAGFVYGSKINGERPDVARILRFDSPESAVLSVKNVAEKSPEARRALLWESLRACHALTDEQRLQIERQPRASKLQFFSDERE